MAKTRSLDLALYTDASSTVDKHYSDVMAKQAAEPVPTDHTKPKVVLVVGPSPFTMPRGWEFFLASPYEGVSYIATVLHNAGFPVRIVDVRYDPTPVETACREIKKDCDVLGLATYEDCYPFLEELIAKVKDDQPRLPVILGGSLVTSVPHVFMNETKADVAVISEGELTILEVMEAYTDGQWDKHLPRIKGIWYRDKNGEVHKNGPRGQMVDLNTLPNMNLSLWPQANGPMGLQPQIISSHSRGCKMDCSFCYRTTPQLREKSPEKLRSELKYLKETYNIKFIFFVDLTFTSNKKRTLAICDVIKEFDIGWTCLTRCADVDPEVLAAMKASGCDIILYGVESLTPAALKDARKGSTETLADRAMRQTQEAGMRFGGLMIVGLPGETEESLDHMARWSEKHRSITRVKYLSAMPGTTVYQQGIGTNLIRSEVDHLRWLAIEQALERDEYLNYNNLPDSVMRQSYKRIYDSYCPGPVMDFQHFPEHFSYFDPNPDQGWRRSFSSAGAPPAPGTEKFYKSPERIFNGV
jgi:radical SAM superfamily enzyme YgiQ (UPF0313 family)